MFTRSLVRSLKGRSSVVSVMLMVGLLACAAPALAQQRRAAAEHRAAPAGGQRAVVVDERLAALRESPELSARLLQRMSRGRKISIVGSRRASEDVTFYRVVLTRRTGGWVQSEAVISPVRKDDDERLLRLIRGSEDFDRIGRAYIFLD